jgi:hypothetical protein
MVKVSAAWLQVSKLYKKTIKKNFLLACAKTAAGSCCRSFVLPVFRSRQLTAKNGAAK